MQASARGSLCQLCGRQQGSSRLQNSWRPLLDQRGHSHRLRALYRWTPGPGGRRKRDSLLDNFEPVSGPADGMQTPDDNSDPGAQAADSAPSAVTQATVDSVIDSRQRQRRRRRDLGVDGLPDLFGGPFWGADDSDSAPSTSGSARTNGWDQDSVHAAAGPLSGLATGASKQASLGSEADASGSGQQTPGGAGASDDGWDDWGDWGDPAAGPSRPSQPANGSDARGKWDGASADPGPSGNGSRSSGVGAADRMQPDDGLDDESAGGWDDGDMPDITLLAPDEVEDLVSLRPTPQQISFFGGDYAANFQRWGGALLVTIVALKYALVAAGAFTYPLWWPVVQATNRNRSVKQQCRHVGLWRAKVLEVELLQRPQPRFSERSVRGSKGVVASEPFVRVLVGDETGARTEVVVPYDASYVQLQAGEPAELLVLSSQRSFARFKALKEVYLPESGVWLAIYPYIARAIFLEISLDIERERHADASVQATL